MLSCSLQIYLSILQYCLGLTYLTALLSREFIQRVTASISTKSYFAARLTHQHVLLMKQYVFRSASILKNKSAVPTFRRKNYIAARLAHLRQHFLHKAVHAEVCDGFLDASGPGGLRTRYYHLARPAQHPLCARDRP